MITSDTVRDLQVLRHAATDLPTLKDDLLTVYERAYADKLADPFFATDRFWQRLQDDVSRVNTQCCADCDDAFGMVTGRLSGELVGYALGCRLTGDTRWWSGLVDPDDRRNPAVIFEDGKRTFALNEIMVVPEYQCRGFATKIHDYLLIRRPERRVTLLVEPENFPALVAYREWGYRIVGDLQPFPDAPVYVAMIRDLGGTS